MGTTANDVTCVLDARAELGECPVWSPPEQALYWVDILEGRVLRHDTRSGELRTTSTGEEGRPIDDEHGVEDFTDEARTRAEEVCRDFLNGWANEHTPVRALIAEADMRAEQAGHDFWLTRNGHGAGFWDRGLGRVGELLTEAAKSCGEAYVYVADDGTLDYYE